MSPYGCLIVPKFRRVSSWMLCLPALVLFLADFLTSRVGFASGPEVLGLSLGASPTEVRELFQQKGITVTEPTSGVISASQPPTFLQGVKEIRCVFAKDALYKIVLDFEIPPREPTAANLVAIYEKEKQRIKDLFGEPGQDVVVMGAPTPQERHEWLKRGRAYYKSAWTVGGGMRVVLWLYGEDADIVLVEVYETTDK